MSVNTGHNSEIINANYQPNISDKERNERAFTSSREKQQVRNISLGKTKILVLWAMLCIFGHIHVIQSLVSIRDEHWDLIFGEEDMNTFDDGDLALLAYEEVCTT